MWSHSFVLSQSQQTNKNLEFQEMPTSKVFREDLYDDSVPREGPRKIETDILDVSIPRNKCYVIFFSFDARWRSG